MCGDIARQVMRQRHFKAVRDALRTRLQFRDVLYRDEIERIAYRSPVFPDATSFRLVAPRLEAASAGSVQS